MNHAQPMLASLADAPLDDPAARLRTEIRRHPRDRRDRAGRASCGCGRGSATRRRAQFPEDRGGAGDVGAQARRSRSCSTARSSRSTRRASRPASSSSRAASICRSRATDSTRHAIRPQPPLGASSRSTSCATGRTDCAIGRWPSGAPRSKRLFAQDRHRRSCGSATGRAATARALYKRALERGWEGLIAKHADSLYKSGKRTPDWRKLKIVHEQEFVIGGWTEPRQTRAYSARCCSASTSGDRLVYVGHTGTGFNERELARVMKLLKPLETRDCPFANRPKTNERPHWVRPELVAQIKFTEWTADDKLRHPVYLGLRDDKKPRDVRREKRRGGCAASAIVATAQRPSTLASPATPQRRDVANRSRTARERRAHELPNDRRCRRSTAATSKTSQRDGDARRCPTADARRHQPAQGVLAEAEAHQGRSVPLLRAGRAGTPAGGRRSAAGDEALSQRRRRAAVLSAPRAETCRAGVRIEHGQRRRRSGRRSSAAI